MTLGDDLSLPEECWRVFVDERAEISDSPMPTTAGFLTEDLKSSIIRHGITTIIPEVLLHDWCLPHKVSFLHCRCHFVIGLGGSCVHLFAQKLFLLAHRY